ncbi:DUF1553 domain-containing protein [Prosthecobacter sp.]|uniref:DUF1553 domain-containing protein n=1 Tax=Prosthecobacter sp. TaxID=1965333 RepID=UPI002AB957AD|nr:DUF1553 domain-containing protein [Prosthecobacter sp.]MDZ4404050.1 DUF1553 domain-containing protein [Prosthecobacter sp.]
MRRSDSICVFVLMLFGMSVTQAVEAKVQFNRDVRSILSNKCFRCHGFDEKSRKADLRLDQREGAIANHDGKQAVAPGKPQQSELIHRINTTEADDLMPPPESKQSLTSAEKNILRRWIAEGAEYEAHWSLIPPKPSSPPQNSIDDFILARLKQAGLKPAPAASRETLLRRVSLDLTGLPPTLAELDAFISDQDPQAYEHAVDRFLASKHFGERMAVEWLDAARYADTNGYFGDKTRSLWPWRDWVIDAYNRNLPFDKFTIEQLAGDLLPNATTAQRIATGFNRNHMANNESGIIDEEYRVEYVADRLETTGTTWLGLTIGCARCHDHKYDPITQREFYQLFAFFNNLPEQGLIKADNPPPLLSVPSTEQETKLQQLTEARKQAEHDFAPMAEALRQQIAQWEKSLILTASPSAKLVTHQDFNERIDARQVGTSFEYPSGILGQSAKFDATQHAEWDGQFDADAAWTIGVWLMADTSLSCVLSKIEPQGNRRGFEVIWQKGRFQINLVNRWGSKAIEAVTVEPVSAKKWHHLVLSYDGSRKAAGLKVFLNGKLAALNLLNDTLDDSFANTEPLRIGRRDSGLGFYGQLDELRVLQRTTTAEEAESWFWSERLRGIIAQPTAKRSSADATLLQDYFVDHQADATTKGSHLRVQKAKQAEAALRESIPTTLVMQEMDKPRTAHVLTRGQYDHPTDPVQPGVPVALSAWPANAPKNRLGFAKWLVSPDNPLTARVAVNRLWQQCFGEGLVRTVNDFGSQGEAPTHPELLDWLALRFMQSGWDVKALLKLIVMSATYQRSSQFSVRDPSNLLLARGPSFRLSAEMVRDQALAVSGLLVPHIGGPSVRPYQPPGLWEAVSYNGEETYVPDTTDGLWRRSLYSFWKRQSPPPALLTFDSPTREKCTVRRARTNTPLQALVLLNDETYVEAARALAAWTLSNQGVDESRLTIAFRRVTSRMPAADEIQTLTTMLRSQRTRFAAHREEASKLIAIGASKHGRDLDPVELAAWTVTLHALFNLDETITRR